MFKSLSSKILASMLLILSIILAGYSYTQYKKTEERLTNDGIKLHQTIIANNLPTMGETIWNFNMKTLKKSLESVFEHGSFHSIHIFTEEGEAVLGMKKTIGTDSKVELNAEEGFAYKQILGKDFKGKIYKENSSVELKEPPKWQEALKDLDLNSKDSSRYIHADVWRPGEEGEGPTFVGQVYAVYDLKDVKEYLENQKIAILTFSGILALLLLIPSFLMLRFLVIQPVKALSSASKSVAKGNLERVQDGKARQDELGTLTQNFNEMVDSLQLNNEQMETLVSESKSLASLNDLQILAEKTTFAVKALSRQKASAELYFTELSFPELSLEKGLHKINDGSITVFPSERDRDKDAHIAVDPQTKEEVARCFIIFDDSTKESDKQNIEKGVKTLLTSIASSINTVRLKYAMKVADEKSQEIRRVFSKIEQGICTIDGEFNLSPEYSKYLETIFERENLTEFTLLDLLFKNSNLGVDAIDQVKNAVECSVDQDSLSFETNCDIFPYEVSIGGEDNLKHLELDWVPIENEDEIVTAIMVTIRDVTAIRAWKAKAEAQQNEIKMLGELISLGKTDFDRFRTNFNQSLEVLFEKLQKIRSSDPTELHDMMKVLHTIKGNSRTYGLTFLVDILHATETTVQELHQKFQSLPEEQIRYELESVTESLNQSRKNFEIYVDIFESKIQGEKDAPVLSEELFNELLNIVHSDETIQEPTLQKLESHFWNLRHRSLSDLKNVAIEALKKTVEMIGGEVPTVELLSDADYYPNEELISQIENALVHICTNSVTHGKAKKVDIEIKTDSNEKIRVRFKEQGNGLNLTKIAEKANVELSESNAQIVAEKIFQNSLSTADEITECAGRGAGLAAVIEEIEKSKGLVNLIIDSKFSDPQSVQFEIEFVLPKETFKKVIPKHKKAENEIAAA